MSIALNLKTVNNPFRITYFLIALFLLVTSCRKETFELIEGSTDKNLMPNSTIANLLERIALNDGSLDNIIDKANCFTVQLPITVVANGEEIEIVSVADYNVIEYIFNASDSDEDTLDIQFPINLIGDNFMDISVTSQTELSTLASMCNGENITDDDIECIDFNYPITISIYNKTTELTDRITISNDNQLYIFIESLDDNLVANVDFPITVVFADGTLNEINNLAQLETTINAVKDSCDEDDDYDYNDDNEEEDHELMSITRQEFNELLTACKWTIEEFELNGQNVSLSYNSNVFIFKPDGTITDENSDVNPIGTWSTSATGDELVLQISMDSLIDFDGEWSLHEINLEDDGTQLEIEKSEDEIKLKQDCP